MISADRAVSLLIAMEGIPRFFKYFTNRKSKVIVRGSKEQVEFFIEQMLNKKKNKIKSDRYQVFRQEALFDRPILVKDNKAYKKQEVVEPVVKEEIKPELPEKTIPVVTEQVENKQNVSVVEEIKTEVETVTNKKETNNIKINNNGIKDMKVIENSQINEKVNNDKTVVNNVTTKNEQNKSATVELVEPKVIETVKDNTAEGSRQNNTKTVQNKVNYSQNILNNPYLSNKLNINNTVPVKVDSVVKTNEKNITINNKQSTEVKNKKRDKRTFNNTPVINNSQNKKTFVAAETKKETPVPFVDRTKGIISPFKTKKVNDTTKFTNTNRQTTNKFKQQRKTAQMLNKIVSTENVADAVTFRPLPPDYGEPKQPSQQRKKKSKNINKLIRDAINK